MKISGVSTAVSYSWSRHQMETFSALLAICAVPGEFANGRWRGALMFSLICTRLNGWVNNREAGDLRRYRTHYDVTVLYYPAWPNDDLMRYWISSLFPHVMRYRINRNLATNIDCPYRDAIMFWGRRGGFPLAGKRSQWTHDVMIASLLRQNVAATSF